MLLTRIFVLCFIAGIAGGYVFWSRSASAPLSELASPSPAAVEEQEAQAEPLVATPEPAPAPPPRPAPRRVPAPLPPEGDYAKAQELVDDEPLTPVDVRVLLEQVLAGKLPRELSPRDYDRLTAAVMRVRAAERVLRGVDETAASAELRAEHRAVLIDATSEVERITGVELSALSKVVDPHGGVTEEGDEDPAEIVHETLPE